MKDQSFYWVKLDTGWEVARFRENWNSLRFTNGMTIELPSSQVLETSDEIKESVTKQQIIIEGYETDLHRIRQEFGSCGTQAFSRGVSFMVEELKKQGINIKL